MEAQCMWQKSTGIFVLEKCIVNKSFYGRDLDHVYDSVVVDFVNKRMWVYDGSHTFFWSSFVSLPVPCTMLKEFIYQTIQAKPYVDVYEMIRLVKSNFGKCKSSTTEIIIMEIQQYRHSILDKFENFLPAVKIQRSWKRCVSDPSYQVCRKRLMNEFQVELVF